MDALIDSRSGMMCRPLMAIDGAVRSTSFREDSHAKTSAISEADQASMDRDLASGRKCRGSFVKYDRDLSSWKTHQFSLLGGLESFSATWPNWGTMRDGECWALDMLEPHTNAIGSGSWQRRPTRSACNPILIRCDGGTEIHQSRSIPTPTASDWKGSSRPGQRRRQLTDPAMGVIPAGEPINPSWVEWLMGWPIGWTDCEPLETAKFRQWLCAHGKH